MKYVPFSIIFALMFSLPGRLPGQEIKLTTCIDSALANKGNIIAVRTGIDVARLQTSAAFQKYLPDLSLSYNYRYNLVIPTQIIPLGQFSQVPTDEKRPIKFGTDWQQNSGLSLYQPIIDFSIKSRVDESRINEKLKNTDLAAAERDLTMEVIRTFTNIWLREGQLRSAELDTLRTFRTKELFAAKSKEGKVLRTEINRAQLNHNSSLSAYASVRSSLAREKIYMGFLTGMSPEVLLEGSYDYSPFQGEMLKAVYAKPVFDSLPSVASLKLRAELLQQQQRSEKMKNVPAVGFEGFVGANQYTDEFNPFLADSWYGSSYLGLSLRFQILSGNSTRNRVRELKLEEQGLSSRLSDEISSISNQNMRLGEEIREIEYKADIHMQNIGLYEENLSLNKERFEKGQINAYDLLSDEVDYQKELSKFNELRAELVYKQIELLSNSGSLSAFIASLR